MTKSNHSNSSCNETVCHEVSHDLAPADELTFSPKVDIYETPSELIMECELPGVDSEELEVRFENQDLEIRAKVKARQECSSYLRREYRVGNFFRAFTLGEVINSDAIEASLTDGLLRLRLPKHQAAKPRRIKVTAA